MDRSKMGQGTLVGTLADLPKVDFDIDLDEFSDEIDEWVIDELKRVGCDTARSVLDLTAEELERRTDLEKETIADLRKVLQDEFDRE